MRGPATILSLVIVLHDIILKYSIFSLLWSLRPDLMRDRKRKTAFFDVEFFDQKNKAILCARILAISEQHFSI